MDAPPPTVFLSYRRHVSWSIARLIFTDLREHGYDVFMDVESIDSGQFGTIILAQIAARAHFLVILTHGTLQRYQEPDDWLRREIEHAIALQRNVVPILVDDFHFDDNASIKLTGSLRALSRYNGLSLPQDYFDEAMDRLRTRFLKQPLSGEITPAPSEDTSLVQDIIEGVARQPAPTAQELSQDHIQARQRYKTDAKDVQWARIKRWMLLSGAILAALIIAIAAAMYYAWPSPPPPPPPNGGTSENLSIPTILGGILLKGNGIAEFGEPSPHNNAGYEWQTFSDGRWGGTSTIRYEMVRHRRSHPDSYMSLDFTIGPSFRAYCGVYTEFSFPPAVIIDLSAFKGIEFRARYKVEKPEDQGAVQFLLQVANYGVPEFHYHEKAFLLEPNDPNDLFTPLRIEFTELKKPPFATHTIDFKKTKVFRVALVIRGEGGGLKGQLDFDDMRLFKPGE